MTVFDAAVILVIALSTLFAFLRGVVRELIALIAWVAGFIAALAFTPMVGSWIPDFGHPALRYLIAFALILIGTPLVVMALSLKPWLPPQWAERLDYSRDGARRAATPVKV